MSKLSPEAAALLAAARKNLGASAEVAARVKSAVDARVNAAVTARVDHVPPPSGVRLRRVWSAVRRPGQVFVLALVGSVLVSKYVASSSAHAPEATPPGPESSVAIALESAPPRAEALAERASSELANAVPSVPVTALPDRPLPPAERSPRAREPRAVVPTASAPEVARSSETTRAADDLVEETRLLRAAQVDLQARRTDAAMRSLDQHAARFPAGVLREERLTLRVLVLCETREVEAARRARAELDRSFPSTSHASRLANSCAAAGPEGAP
ncbi:MAG: hypothetical protein K0S65_1552 [Labilithrix sp.]|nr:hypothetical protein [Labilithrix sp.]